MNNEFEGFAATPELTLEPFQEQKQAVEVVEKEEVVFLSLIHI